jgi:hypothetical protein
MFVCSPCLRKSLKNRIDVFDSFDFENYMFLISQTVQQYKSAPEPLHVLALSKICCLSADVYNSSYGLEVIQNQP